mgnify:CR=1 FL=1
MKPKTRWWGMLLAAERSVLGSLRLDPAEPTLTGVAILLVQDFGMTSMPLPTPPPANIYIPFAFTVEEDLAGKVTVWTLNTAIVLTNTNEGSSLQVNLLFLDRGGGPLPPVAPAECRTPP